MNNKTKYKRKNAGFTLVELITVISIVSIIVVIASGPLSSIFRARKKAVTTEISAMISQCKINALSGMANEFQLTYSAEDDAYICSLVYTNGENEGKAYKTQKIGSGKNNITVNDSISLLSDTLTIAFSGKTGAVTKFQCSSNDLSDNKTNKITVDSSATHSITLYMLTGKQESTGGIQSE